MSQYAFVERELYSGKTSAIAYHKKTDEIMGVGQKAYDMLEKTPPQIVAVQPLLGGVVGDFNLTTDMIKVFLQRVCGSSMVKPRVVICVPSVITEVEARAVIDAAMSAGARKVCLVKNHLRLLWEVGLILPNHREI